VSSYEPASSGGAATALDIGVFGARAIPSTYSGYETFLTTLLPALAARGHEVTMYCRPGEVDGEGPYRGVHREVLPAIPGKQFNTLSHGAVAAVQARRRRHDVLLVVNVANAPFCALSSRTGQPVLLNTDGQEWLRGKWGRVAKTWFKTSARLAKYGATGLIADCAAMADVYEREFGAESTVIPYCFPDIPFEPDPALLDRFGVTAGGFAIVGGRLNPENNIDTVVEAWTRSSTDLPLLVLGAANYASPVLTRLEHLADLDDRIRLAGHVHDRREFLTILALASAYIHGHSVGGMNPSLVEAMGAGALVAALDTPFNRETMGPTGRVFARDCHDVVEVVDELRATAEDEQTALRAASSTRVRERFAVADVVGAYEDLLIDAASGRARRRLQHRTRWSSP
jgi:glycosyltransferase involved in cell wall biosynthesis